MHVKACNLDDTRVTVGFLLRKSRSDFDLRPHNKIFCFETSNVAKNSIKVGLYITIQCFRDVTLRILVRTLVPSRSR